MIAGVDGYRGGWLVAMSESWYCDKPPVLKPCDDFASVLRVTEACGITVVDMPIGMPSARAHRTCDEMARTALGKAGQDRVFFCPPRESLQAKTVGEFQAIHRRITGKGAGLPVWGIRQKLKEVDFAMNPELQRRVREFHPELTWKRLAGSVLASKHGATGLLQRVDVLNKHNPSWLRGLKTDHLPTTVSLDDVLDSLVGISVADAIARDTDYKGHVPEGEPPKDDRGLRMDIWF
jgi:predicted RNase H-like nuclease